MTAGLSHSDHASVYGEQLQAFNCIVGVLEAMESDVGAVSALTGETPHIKDVLAYHADDTRIEQTIVQPLGMLAVRSLIASEPPARLLVSAPLARVVAPGMHELSHHARLVEHLSEPGYRLLGEHLERAQARVLAGDVNRPARLQHEALQGCDGGGRRRRRSGSMCEHR